MNDDKLQLEVRLTALEIGLTYVAKAAFLAAGVTPQHVREMRERAGARLRNETYPRIDPVWADHFSGELEAEVDRLLSEFERALTALQAAPRDPPSSP